MAHDLNVAMGRDLPVRLTTPEGEVAGYPVLKLRERIGVYGLAAEPRGQPVDTVALSAIERLAWA